MSRVDADSLGEALGLRTQVRRGAVAGLALATTAFVLFVAVPGGRHSPVLYLALAFVVATTAGGLVTTALVAYRAHRLATREG
ncbi:MAG: hypothetical protein ABEJ42_00065 [Halobacteriaceae archaeon]